MENIMTRGTMAPGGGQGGYLKAGVLTQPPPEFSPAYFWSLNDALEERVLLAQLRDMHAAACVPSASIRCRPSFAPETMANAMSPPYLSDEYFRLIRRIVEECAALGMHFYLYDEAAWPSGSAAGRVHARNPREFGRKRVGFDEIKLESGKIIALIRNPHRRARNAAGIVQILAPGAEVTAAGPDMTLRIFKIRDGQGPTFRRGRIRYAWPRAQTFIELTHENYARHVGDRFGGNIKFAFTDGTGRGEPSRASFRTGAVDVVRGPAAGVPAG